MKIIAIIPVRMESTRFPKKVLLNIQNLPMFVHIYKQVKLSKYIEEVFIATDHPKIIFYSKKYKINYLKTKKSHTSGTSRIIECLNLIKNVDMILNVQADEPLVTPRLIEDLILKFKENYNQGIATFKKKIDSFEDIYFNENCVKVFTNQEKAKFFFRNLLPSFYSSNFYFKHIGIYLFHINSLLKIKKELYISKKFQNINNLEQIDFMNISIPIYVFETKDVLQSIDTPEDFKKLKKILN